MVDEKPEIKTETIDEIPRGSETILFVDEEKAKELGLAAYVMKPINMSEVAQTTRKVLDKK